MATKKCKVDRVRVVVVAAAAAAAAEELKSLSHHWFTAHSTVRGRFGDTPFENTRMADCDEA